MSEAPALHRDFADLLGALAGTAAEYLVVGAYAMAFHGVPRATGDLDVLVRPTEENAHRVWRALADFGAPLEATGLTLADLATPGTIYQMGLPPRRIDVLTTISGVSFEEAWSTHVDLQVDSGVVVPVIGLDALVRNKRATGRPKDLADLEVLDKRPR
jgi:hypothetical protein